MSQRIKYFVAGCLRLLWMVFFRPNSFRREMEQPHSPRWEEDLDSRRRWKLLTQAFVVTIATSMIFTALTGLLLEAIGISFNFARGLRDILVIVIAGAVGGAVVGAIGGIAVFIAIIIATVVADNITFGIASGFVFGVVSGVSFVLVGGFDRGIVRGIALSFLIGVFGFAGGLEGFVGWLVGYFRLFLLPLEAVSTFWLMLRVSYHPDQAMHFLRKSPAYWDEAMLLPQPFLRSLLVLAGKQDRSGFLDAVNHLTTNTFQQGAAIGALLEFIRFELSNRHMLGEIALARQNFRWVSTLPEKAMKAFNSSGAIEAVEQCRQISAEVAAAISAASNYQKQLALNRARRELDDLRQFAIFGLRGRESRVFARIAQQWFDAVNGEINRLTEEDRITKRLPNPYIAAKPLSPGNEAFTGRTNAFSFIEHQLLRGDQNVPVVLHGQRRIGKSSLLRNFEAHLTTNLIPVYVDMQRSALVESTGGLLFNLAGAINRELARRGVHLKQPELKDYAAEPFIVFGKFLDEVEEAIHAPEKRIILALDEFEVIEQKLIEGKVSSDLLPFLRNMMQHRQGFSLIFAGGHTLDEMISDSWIQYFNTAVPLRLSYLDETSARKLITQPIEEFPLNYEPEAVDLLIEQTNCHPCLIQLTCQALVDMKNEQRSRHATVEDVEQALKKSLDNDYALRSLWDWIPENERPLLAWLASAGSASIGQMTRALLKSEAEMRGITEHLVKAEVLRREGSPPVYRFQVPLFRQWVARYAVLKGMEFGQRQVAD